MSKYSAEDGDDSGYFRQQKLDEIYHYAEAYRPGDRVITADGMIAVFLSYKMDNKYATIQNVHNQETEVCHTDNFRLYRAHPSFT